MRVVFCDVGQGDATLVSFKNWQMLIDMGAANKKVLNCLQNNVPFWDKKIEMVVITHHDSDHDGGLADVSKFYKIEQIFDSKNLSQFDLIKNSMIEFEVVNPPSTSSGQVDKNENSIAGVLKFKSDKNGETKRIFMAADIDIETEQRLVWQGLIKEPVDILKVSHHGSKNGTSEELLDVLKAKMAVISVGAKNRFGHPTKEVLERLKKKNIEIKRTDLQGEVHVMDVIENMEYIDNIDNIDNIDLPLDMEVIDRVD